MPLYSQQNLGTSLSAIVTFDDAQDEAIRGFESGIVEPTVKTVGMLWRCLDAARLLALGVQPEITGAYLQWSGAAWQLFADVDFPCLNAAGEVPLVGPLKMNNNQVYNLAAGTLDHHAVRRDQVMMRSGINAATANMPMGGFKITGLANGVDPQDAVTVAQIGAGLARIAHFRTTGGGAGRIDSGWTPGTTTFVQRINTTAFTPERAELFIRARINDADDAQNNDLDFKLTAAIPRWRHAVAADDNGGLFPVVVGKYKREADGTWLDLTGTFNQASQAGASPDAYDFRSDGIVMSGETFRLFLRFHLGATKGVEFWFRRNDGVFADLDEVGTGGEGIVQLFVQGA